MEKRIEKELSARDETLAQNDLTLARNLSILDENGARISGMVRDMERYEAEVDREIRQADELQADLFNRVADLFNRLSLNKENKEN